MGKIITFYSYKGGVGRTMALANVAVILAQWDFKVLVVDWDLEAPGLEYFFRDYLDLRRVRGSRGIVDLLVDAYSSEENTHHIQWEDSLVTVSVPDSEVRFDLITAGQRGAKYFERVKSLDLEDFYARRNGEEIVERLRDEWKKEYDFVLIDSRTGVTDVGGICTIQLPDKVVLLFTATDQSFDGILDVAHKAAKAQQDVESPRYNLVFLPVPCRFDTGEEFKLSQKWLDKFSRKLMKIYAAWLPSSVDRREFLEKTKIPYAAYFSFGEKLPVVEQGTTDTGGLGYAYENIAALVADNLTNAHLLIENRDELVRRASREKRASISKRKVFICYSHRDEDWKDRLVSHLSVLEKDGMLEIWDDRRIAAGHDWYAEMMSGLDSADVVILLITAAFLSSDFILTKEVPSLLQRRENEGVWVIPLIVRPCVWQQISWLRVIQAMPKDGKTLSGLSQHGKDQALAEVAREIFQLVIDRDRARSEEALDKGISRDTLFEALRKGGLHLTVNTGGYQDVRQEQSVDVSIGIKIEQAIGHLDDLERVIEEQPKGKLSETVKKKGLEIVHDALKDVAKRQLGEAAKKIFELGKEFGPAILSTAGYSFFKSFM